MKKLKEFEVTCKYIYVAEDREGCIKWMDEDSLLNNCINYDIEELKSTKSPNGSDIQEGT